MIDCGDEAQPTWYVKVTFVTTESAAEHDSGVGAKVKTHRRLRAVDADELLDHGFVPPGGASHALAVRSNNTE